jgi:head-tail adaptor
MNPGRMNRLVSLSRAPQTTPDSDGFFEALNPATAWVAIEPFNPGVSDDTRGHAVQVTMRYHPQVTLDTRLVYGTTEYFVKGVQNLGDANRELVLFCETVTP